MRRTQISARSEVLKRHLLVKIGMHEFKNAAYTMRRQAAPAQQGFGRYRAMRGYQQSCNGRLHAIEEEASAGILTLAFRFKRKQKTRHPGIICLRCRLQF